MAFDFGMLKRHRDSFDAEKRVARHRARSVRVAEIRERNTVSRFSGRDSLALLQTSLGSMTTSNDEKVIDQALRIEAFSEVARRADLLDCMRPLRSRLRRKTENLDERELGPEVPGGLHAIHVGHGDVHQNDIGPKAMRLSDRFEPVSSLADNTKLRSLL